MILKTAKILPITVFITASILYLASCASTDKQAIMEKPAGESTLLPRSFEGAPPLIPHEVEEDMACLECHRLGENDAVITSHPERFNCIQCHIPQDMDVEPFVESMF